MLTNEELAALVETGDERRGIEFKSAGSTSAGSFVATVARACIALANQRDGGHVVVGVVDKDPGGYRGGVSPEHLEEWLDYDVVMEKINVYADPPLKLRVEKRELPSGAPVIVIEVAEFDQVPILSNRDHGSKIYRGHLYTRSMAKPESSRSNTQNELREVLELAAEKQLHAFLRTANRAGLTVEPVTISDTEHYKKEVEAFREAPISSGLMASAHVSVSIKPTRYLPERLDYEALVPLVGATAVRLRGWPLPFVESPEFRSSWVAETNLRVHPETWSMHQSGQFISVHPLPGDYGPDRGGFGSQDPNGNYLPVYFPVLFMTEAVLLATRLQKEIAPDEEFTVQFGFESEEPWELVIADPRRSGFHQSYKFTGGTWKHSIALPSDSVAVDFREAAAEAARALLLRFGWMGVTTELVRGLQDQVFD